MAKSDTMKMTQAFLLKKNQDLLWIILRLGGQIHKQQLCRLLERGKTISGKVDTLIKNLKEAQLVKMKFLGYNKIIVLCKPVYTFFELDTTQKMTAQKLQRSTLVMERNLTLYNCQTPAELRANMETTTTLYYYPKGYAAREFIGNVIDCLKSNSLQWDTTTMNNEDDIQALYKLECVGIFLNMSAVMKNTNNNTIIIYADYFLTAEIPTYKIAKRLVEAERVISASFADCRNFQNNVDIYFNIYSHAPQNDKMIANIFTLLLRYNEFNSLEKIKKKVKFHFCDTKHSLFGNMGSNTFF